MWFVMSCSWKVVRVVNKSKSEAIINALIINWRSVNLMQISSSDNFPIWIQSVWKSGSGALVISPGDFPLVGTNQPTRFSIKGPICDSSRYKNNCHFSKVGLNAYFGNNNTPSHCTLISVAEISQENPSILNSKPSRLWIATNTHLTYNAIIYDVSRGL